MKYRDLFPDDLGSALKNLNLKSDDLFFIRVENTNPADLIEALGVTSPVLINKEKSLFLYSKDNNII